MDQSEQMTVTNVTFYPTDVPPSPPAVDPAYRTFKIVLDVFVVFLLCVFGISGNIVSILVLGKDRAVRRTTGFLLQNLAVADIFYLISCIFFQTIYTIVQFTDWVPSMRLYWNYMGQYVWPCASIAQTCTVWLVVVVTADRYVAICRPLHAPQYSTMSRMRKAVVIVWFLSMAYNIPRFLERHIIYKFNESTNTTEPTLVKSDFRNNHYYVVCYKTILFFFLRFLIPLSCLAFFNTRLIQAIRESYRQRQNMPGDSTRTRREKYSLTLVTVVIVFIICEFPDFFLRFWIALHVFIDQVPFPKKELQWVNCLSNLCLTINSCSNFVIYCFVGKRFRAILFEMLGGKLKGRRPPTLTTRSTRYPSTHAERPEEMSRLMPNRTNGSVLARNGVRWHRVERRR